MPKENTHLYFAESIKEANPKLSKIIDKNSTFFYLGSIAPDTFYYSKNKKNQSISDFLHGYSGVATNTTSFALLNLARKNKDERILAFALGFLTHCYLDIVFHPIIFYLTGNFYDKNPQQRELAVYLHRRLEIAIDEKKNKTSFFGKIAGELPYTDNTLLSTLTNILHVPAKDIQYCFKRQIRLNKLFHRSHLGQILYLLNQRQLLHNKDEVALFYGHLPNDQTLPDEIEYKDLFTSRISKKSINQLLTLAHSKTDVALTSAYRYYQGEETREDAEINISGENLDTGDISLGVEAIKFLKEFLK